ncbi:MAG: exodeoxyribonuclease VII large subunit [Phycisphaerales bacterium]|nr:exodeoxyribonuclease VII large subunit [Phycisphaerales bacterium]
MPRLPFDPDKMKSKAAPAEKAEDAPLSVSALAAKIEGALRTLPPKLRVVGEVSGFRDRTHWYFDLKDAGAVVNCVMFASAAKRAAYTPREGDEVVVSGQVDFYAKGGRVSLIVGSIQPVGAGRLDLAFRQLCEELKAKGWFDESRKKPLPVFPRKIGIVTSRTGAALQDIIDTARRRCPAVELMVFDVRVQGEGSAPEVASAIRLLGEKGPALGVEAIIVTRGGGSMEDLWAFNERAVAEAIVRCPLPVVAAIGHETDTTIAELVADLRCATPTQAAMRLIPDREALGRQLDSLARRMGSGVARHLQTERHRLVSASRHPVLSDPRSIIDLASERLDARARRASGAAATRLAIARRRLDALALRLERHRPGVRHAKIGARLEHLAQRLSAAAARRTRLDLRPIESRLRQAIRADLRDHRVRLEGLERELEAVGPASVLRRGYSFTRLADGAVVRSVGQATPGAQLRTTVSDGEFTSTISGDGSVPPPARRPDPAAPPPRRRSARRKRRDDPDQLDLFGRNG